MLIPPEQLIDGCVRTLLETVLPGIESRFARGQLYAVADVLRNLRDRLEEKNASLELEAQSLNDSLGRAASALRATGHTAAYDVGLRIDKSLAAAPTAPLSARLGALRTVMASALEALDGLSEDVTKGAKAALGGHFAAQAVREVMILKPSLLSEISKG
ncbi:MAG TPA: hypothetical protein VKM54_07595 [Myxococcota bacterium]|nr:hypothetical protein [Myxococcota bacterium]